MWELLAAVAAALVVAYINIRIPTLLGDVINVLARYANTYSLRSAAQLLGGWTAYGYGVCVVDYALQKGLQVRLLYRSEATVPELFKGKVELCQGNVVNYDDCKRVIEGVDGVCVILGTRSKLEAITELSRGTANLL
uniref:NAD(P)-binding domain-containing protein n=1 Tax=Glossina palpalis gambiensis TaxID=67801 RepID=A0A1B0BY65_9MUSC